MLKLVQQEVRIGKGQRRKKRRRSRRWRNYSQGTGHKSQDTLHNTYPVADADPATVPVDFGFCVVMVVVVVAVVVGW